MNHVMEGIAHNIFDKTMQLARIQAQEELRTTTSKEVRAWVEQEVLAYTAPLQEEINQTHSLWVKFRNTMYIKLAKASIDLIVCTIVNELDKLRDQTF